MFELFGARLLKKRAWVPNRIPPLKMLLASGIAAIPNPGTITAVLRFGFFY